MILMQVADYLPELMTDPSERRRGWLSLRLNAYTNGHRAMLVLSYGRGDELIRVRLNGPCQTISTVARRTIDGHYYCPSRPDQSKEINLIANRQAAREASVTTYTAWLAHPVRLELDGRLGRHTARLVALRPWLFLALPWWLKAFHTCAKANISLLVAFAGPLTSQARSILLLG